MRVYIERVVPETMSSRNGLLKEHIARYEFAKTRVSKRVLDIACGVGYGADIFHSKLLDGCITEYIGVDIDRESINYAKELYGFKNVKFVVEDALNLKELEKLGSFDTIISFETLEHINEDYLFISNLKKLLNPDGKLILSTPYGKGRDYECGNKYHFRQYKEEEFIHILESNELDYEMYYQRDEQIVNKKESDLKYYLMVAICKHKEG